MLGRFGETDTLAQPVMSSFSTISSFTEAVAVAVNARKGVPDGTNARSSCILP